MEIGLVQQVELKISLAGTGRRLEEMLQLFLAPLLQKLTSENPEVVRKVAELLSYIKSQKAECDDMRIPVAKLVTLYRSSVFETKKEIVMRNKQVLSFIALELTSGTGHLALEEPGLLDSFAYGLRNYQNERADIRQNASEQFSLFLLALTQLTSRGHQVQYTAWEEPDLQAVQILLGRLFLLDVNRPIGAQSLMSCDDAAFIVEANAKNGIMLRSHNQSQFYQTKMRVLTFLRYHPEAFKHTLLAAAGDAASDISSMASAEASKMNGYDIDLVNIWIARGSDPLCFQCIEYLDRTHDATLVNPEFILQAVRREHLLIRNSCLRLVKNVVVQHGSPWSPDINMSFFRTVHQFIIDEGWPRAPRHSGLQISVRQLCYELMGYFDISPKTVGFLMQSLERDTPEMGPSIQKALATIMGKGHAVVIAENMLKYMIQSYNDRTRLAAVQLTVRGVPSRDPVSRLILLLGLDPNSNRPDIQKEAQFGLMAKSLNEMPSNQEFVQCIIDRFNFSNASTHIVDNIVIYVYATLVNYVPSTADWYDQLLATLTSTSPPPFETSLGGNVSRVVPIVKLLLSFVEAGISSTMVLSLAIKLLNFMAVTDRNRLADAALVEESKMIGIIRSKGHPYSSFVAEYLPLLAPNAPVPEPIDPSIILWVAFKAALTMECPSDLLDKVMEFQDLDSLKMLALSDNIGNRTDEAEKLASRSQMLMACVSLYASDETRSKIFEKILSFSHTDFDDIIANGEALSVCVSGWQSKLLRERFPYLLQHLDKKGSIETRGQRSKSLEDLAIKSIVTGMRGSRESRRLASVRLLCLVQFSFYEADEYRGYVNGFQTCFMNLLTDSDEITQECAGRGIAILFENCSRVANLGDQLLANMLTNFTDDVTASQQTAGTLTENTELFNAGELPSGPQSKTSLRTYKDVLSLANETGDTSMVYKFMALSASSKLWQGRQGLAFGLEQIMSKSELYSKISNRSALGLSLIPKLFRYLFDPLDVTKHAMKRIWQALVPPFVRNETIKMYLPEIKATLLSGVVEREWRVREASTRGLSELVSLSHVDDNVEVWRAAFRAVDDIKESVTEAGKDLLKVLTGRIVRASSAGKEIDLTELIEFLLKGLEAEATSQFSVQALLKLSETKNFKPFAAQVLTELTLQLSSLEPQALNYVALNSNQTIVDEARLKGLRDSPLMRGMDLMLERGAPTHEEMWLLFPDLIRRCVGVTSELAAARLLTHVCMANYGEQLRGSDQLMSACYKKLWSLNDTVSAQYSAALGYVCRQLPIQSVLQYITQLKKKYVTSEADDSRTRSIVATAFKDISVNANDMFGNIETSILPLAFIGQHGTDGSAKFREVWEHNTGGALSLKLYLNETVLLCNDILENSSVRDLKVTAAKSIGTLAKKLKQEMYATNSAREGILRLIVTLDGLMFGRSWPGKESLFEALVYCYPATVEMQTLKTSVEERVISESKRKNTDYKLAITQSLSRFLKYFDEGLDISPTIIGELETEMATSFMELLNEDNDEQVDAFRSVVSSFQDQTLLFDLIKHALSLKSWKYRLAVCEAIREQPYNENIWNEITVNCATDSQHEKVRLEWCRSAAVYKKQPQVISQVQKMLAIEQSTIVLAELKSIAKSF